MIRLQGTRIFGGFAFGTVCVLKKNRAQVLPASVDDTAAEKERFLLARQKVQQDLKELYEMTLQRTEDEYARIFDVQQMMLDDPEYEQSVFDLIDTEHVCAAY
ncbi:MAG: phosphoenolpyruvate--protein phosphotransferase, partial [Butyrivibrio sp.]|nr:phosphoenolpyruvate--protein phosphotransferase [Butyrivibrio sp.]